MKCNNRYFTIEETGTNELANQLIESTKLSDQIPSDMQYREKMNPGQLKEKNFLQATPQIGMNF